MTRFITSISTITICYRYCLFSHGTGELWDAEEITPHGGSIRVRVARQGVRQASARLGALLEAERQAGLDTPAPMVALQTQIDRLGNELNTQLDRFAAEGLRGGGYGAPAKATTLMHQFGIDGTRVGFIVDDSPLETGFVLARTGCTDSGGRLCPRRRTRLFVGARLELRRPHYPKQSMAARPRRSFCSARSRPSPDRTHIRSCIHCWPKTLRRWRTASVITAPLSRGAPLWLLGRRDSSASSLSVALPS